MRISTIHPVLSSTLSELEPDLQLLGSSELVRLALLAFQRAYRALGDEAGPTLRYPPL